MSYSVKLDVYEGPLELLLELVSRERLDPADVSISTITDEYLRVVSGMGEVDLDLATGFLVLAATLLELKSFKLLPSGTAGDDDVAALLEERDRLLHKLIEYSTFKKVAEDLRAGLDANEPYFFRKAEIPDELLDPAPCKLEGLSPRSIHAAASRAFSDKPAPPAVDVTHVTPMTVSVGEAVAMLLRQIETGRTVTFRMLCGRTASRIDVIVRFLALLELFKDQSVELEQSAPFAEIVVRHRRPVHQGAG